jgi:hypothetical protein
VWPLLFGLLLLLFNTKNIKPLKADCFKPWKSAAQAALFVFQIRKAFIKHKIHAASRIE